MRALGKLLPLPHILAADCRLCCRKPHLSLTCAAELQPATARLSQADLLHGAHLQLRGALRMKDSDRRRVPTRGLEAVLLPEKLKAQLQKVVSHEKVWVWQCSGAADMDMEVRAAASKAP